MRIAVDAMGGDYAPAVVVEGITAALYDFPEYELTIVGHLGKLAYYLEKYGIEDHPRLKQVHAEQVAEMSDPPTIVLRSKKHSSMTECARLLKEGKVDAIVSAGNTGAAVAATKVIARTLPGVERPMIATSMPGLSGRFILGDSGANVDCRPIHLAQFAIMAEVYAKYLFGIDKPTIGLLSVGGEAGKGNIHHISAEELQAIAKISRKSGNIEEEQEQVITNILNLGDRTVRQVMTPRTVTFSLNKDMTIKEAAELHDKWKFHSRAPVYSNDPDNVVGIALSRDIFIAMMEQKGQLKLHQIMHPVKFVPETAPLNRILIDFFERHQHLFVVVDEYGSVTGVISMEDIIEEIVGREIMDESDKTKDMRELARVKKKKMSQEEETL